MHATRGETPPKGRSGDLTRWALCLGLAFACHAAAAAVLVGRWDAPETVAAAPAILVELAPLAVAPPAEPVEVAPGPQQREASAQPAESAPPREAEADIKLPEPPQPPQPTEVQPAQDPAPRRHAATPTSAPKPAERREPRAAAPAPGATMNSSALPSWRSSLLARLERNKRYPADAHARGERGVALLAFSVDRAGGVHHPRIARSSGSAALDRETLSLPERAQPLPPPPAELTGAQIAVTVPVRYDMH